MPTRRAVLLAGAALFGGVSLGYAGGASATAPAPLDLAAGLLPTGDTQLDELRRWAITGPIDMLVQRHVVYLEQLHSGYPGDAYLWYGAERMCEEIRAGRHRDWPPHAAQILLQVLAGIDPEVLPANARRLRKALPQLELGSDHGAGRRR